MKMIIKNNISKFLVLGLVLINILFSAGFLKIDIKLDIQKERPLLNNTRDLLNSMISNKYIVLNDKGQDFLLLNKQNNEDILIRIYASDIFNPTYAVVVDINANDSNLVVKDRDIYKLTDSFLDDLKTSLKVLGCSSEDRFLNNGFECKIDNTDYRVNYIVYENKIRGFLNKSKSKRLFVKIESN